MIVGVGALVLFVIFALVTGWVGKTAQQRGRSPLLWAGIAALVGLAGFFLDYFVAASLMNADDVSIAVTVFVTISPAIMMLAPMIVIGVLLQRTGFGKSRRNEWDVHIVQHGPGKLRVETDRVVLAWADGTRDILRHELQHVEADGECVRLRVTAVPDSDASFAMLPVADGLRPAGRRDLSRQIALRLVAR